MRDGAADGTQPLQRPVHRGNFLHGTGEPPAECAKGPEVLHQRGVCLGAGQPSIIHGLFRVGTSEGVGKIDKSLNNSGKSYK